MLHLPLCAQKGPESYSVKTFTVANGLPSGQIYKLYQDKKGFVWLATSNGLSRFDGKEFKIFLSNAPDRRQLPDNRIVDIAGDSDDNLWVAFVSGRIARFNTAGGEFRQLPYERISAEGDVHGVPTLSFSKDGILNYTMRGSVYVYRYNPKTDDIYNFALPANAQGDFILNSILYKDSLLLVTTDKKLLYFFNLKTNSFLPLFYTLNYYAVFINVLDDYLFYSQSLRGAGVLNLKTGESIKVSKLLDNYNSEITGFEKDRESGQYYATAANGKFFVMRPPFNDNAVVCYDSLFGQGTPLHTIFTTNEGTLLLGTRGAGLITVKKPFKKFELFSAALENLDIRSIRTIIKRGSKLYVSGYFGINIIDVDKKNRQWFDKEKSVYSLCPDPKSPDSILWFGYETFGKVLGKLNLFTGQKVLYDIGTDNRNSHTVYKIIPEQNGNLWVGADNKLIHFNTREGVSTVFSPDDKEVSVQLRWITELPGKILALSCGNGGLQFFNTESKSFFPPEKYGFNITGKYSVLSTSLLGNILCLATNGQGVVLLNLGTKTVTEITTKTGLPHDVVYGIVPDEKGMLWFSCNKGIVRYNPATGELRQFNLDDGLQDNEFNACAFARGDKGELYFGGIKGFNVIRPEQIHDVSNNLPVYLTGVHFLGKDKILSLPDELGDNLTFDYTEFPLRLKFSALTYFDADEVKYYFRLGDSTGKWSALNSSGEMMLAELDGGAHTIYVKAVIHPGVKSDFVYKLIIKVKPPFYKTLWFSLLVLLFTGLAVGFAFRQRLKTARLNNLRLENMVTERTRVVEANRLEILEQKKNLEDLNKELTALNKTKDTFFSIIAHDLRSPFSTLLGSLRILNEDFKRMKDAEKLEFLRGSETLAASTFDLLENLLQWAQIQRGKLPYNPVKFNPQIIVRKILSLNASALQNKRIIISNEIPGDVFLVTDENIFFFIIRNILNNAIKFTPLSGAVALRYSLTGSHHCFSVTDSGVGMNPEAIAILTTSDDHYSTHGTAQEKGTGLGIRLCISMLKLAGGRLEIQSCENAGSTFTVMFPVNTQTGNGDKNKAEFVQ